MQYNVTSLVNNVILPQTEPSDILGLERIQDVVSWIMLPTADPMNLAVAFAIGAIPTIIIIEGSTFIGTSYNKIGDNVDVKGIEQRLKANAGFEETAC